ncbi:AfsR/SARP family transcriptional regulator [Actinosynnema pretiosum]|uniref:OmpR/PhoB-type domain-containing protein n=1 Tax=Actinosynnema pretiosum TaxID=42197 RepID=A0A290Z9M0_9PSEU|nr:BTAD domain-containing putative transcriptional regulator [Actinosynnema pretiosum]ATE55669.1 hypothetical protein CNX65_22235 [Actinosynnema pretiosum]
MERADVDFRLLGSTVLRSEDGTPVEDLRQQLCTLAVLLMLECGTPVPRHRIKEALWPEDVGAPPPKGADDVVDQTVSKLRKLIGKELVITSGAGYRLAVDKLRVDLHAFNSLVERAREQNPAERSALLHEALGLWRGDTPIQDALPGERGDAIRRSLIEARLHAVDQRLAADLELGKHDELISELRALVDAHPERERFHYHLMLALHRSGRSKDAQAVYRRLVGTRAAEGGAPSSPVDTLHDLISTRDPSLDPPVRIDRARLHRPQDVRRLIAPFTGRRGELDEITRFARSGARGPVVVLVSGVAGIGKSWLVRQWATLNQERFPDGMLYVNLHGFSSQNETRTPAEALQVLFDGFRIPLVELPRTHEVRVSEWDRLISDMTLLVVLDNAATAEQVRHLIPTGRNVMVLITCRSHLTGLATEAHVRQLHLRRLPHLEAVDLLTTKLGADLVTANPQATGELLDACAGHPLALAVLSARVGTGDGAHLRELVEELRTTGLAAFDTDDPDTSLSAILDFSLRALSRDERQRYAYLGLMPGPDVTPATAAALFDAPLGEARSVLGRLVRASLLEEAGGGHFELHDLVRAHAASRAARWPDEEEAARARGRVIAYLLRATAAADELLAPGRVPIVLPAWPARSVPPGFSTPNDAQQWLARHHRMLLAAQRVAEQAGDSASVWKLAWALHTFHARCWHREEHLDTWQRGQAAAAAIGDPLIMVRVSCMHSGALARTGRSEAALELVESALRIAETNGDHEGRVLAHRFLSWYWLEIWSDYGNGLRHATATLHLLRQHDCGTAAIIASTHNTIGWCHANLGDHEQARTHCAQALEHAQEHNDLALEAACSDSLGLAALSAGEHRVAVENLVQALEILIVQHNDVAATKTLDLLAEALTGIDRADLADEALRLAGAFRRDLPRSEREDRARQVVRRVRHLLVSPG